MALVAAACSGTGEVAIDYPASQQAFFSLNQECQDKYATGQNDIQKSLAFNQCNQDRLQFSKEREINGWVGEITDLSTDQGADVVSLTINATIDGFDVVFGTVTNRVSDYATGSMITQKNPLFNVLAQMKEGDLVSFDATFLPHPESDRGVWESSLTEQGSMDAPEFSIRFVDVRPYRATATATATATAAAGTGALLVQPKTSTGVPLNVAEDEPSYDSASEVQQDEPETTSGESGNDSQSIVGSGYSDGKLKLVAAGFVPEAELSDAYPHEVDGNPGSCGNAGCSVPWRHPGSGEGVCIGLDVNDDVDQSRWKISAVHGGECD
ncbi:hypothetical protein ACFQZQ_12510 [Lysobacter koreensis]|uniref:DUF5666 domain-containing protein n=1 Tax=Lysobacter koreensis TaxID=266122 RepID=A0ABW2YS40_9GAMM